MFRIISTTRSPGLDAERAQARGRAGDVLGVLAEGPLQPLVVRTSLSQRDQVAVCGDGLQERRGDGRALDDSIDLGALVFAMSRTPPSHR